VAEEERLEQGVKEQRVEKDERVRMYVCLGELMARMSERAGRGTQRRGAIDLGGSRGGGGV
jgi:hypothetical protein